MDASEASEQSSSDAAWGTLLGVVRTEYADAVEKTVERTQTMRSYHDVEPDAIREAVRSNYEAVLDGLDERRLPDARDDGSVFDAAGETRARQGVDLAEMLALWRLGLEHLHELARRVATAGPGREALLLEFLELALAWADFAMVNAANGHRRGELSIAREQQHVQTNLVRRVLAGIAAPAEIRSAITPLGLDSDGQYYAVRARPEPAVDMEAIERYLDADGMVRRGNGLVALIDGDACGFVGRLPQTAAPTAIGISDQVALSAMEPAFRQAGRALETALALGAKGIFSFGDLSIQSAIASDADLGAVMLTRYVDSVLALPAGSAILDTVERYLANDRSVDLTAKDLDVHRNTVRHRLERFEETTGRSLRETETLVELWWALQRRRLG
jgi:PucR C-terminal helix-turn-helix domain